MRVATIRLFISFFLPFSLAYGQTYPEPNLITWSKEQRLTWYDFKAEPPINKYMEYHAMSRIEIFVKINDSCNCIHSNFSVDIATFFYPSQSWAKKLAKVNLKTLQHEQLHFDLSELIARRFRKVLLARTFSKKKYKQQVMKAWGKYKRMFFFENRKFDNETNGGGLLGEQERWRAEVINELTALDDFSSTRLKLKFE